MNRKQQIHHELSLTLWAMCLAALTLIGPTHAEDREHPPQAHRVGASDDVTTDAGGDMPGTYMEDLSAFGRSARISASVGARTARSSTGQGARGADVDVVALRAWMQSPEFDATDELGTYMEDWTDPVVMAGAAKARQARLARSAVETVSGFRRDRQPMEISVAGPSWSQRERGTRP